MPARPAPSLPHIPRLQLAARSRPFDKSQMGGDFCDVFALAPDAWGVVMGDVCGKGPEAAALGIAARSALRASAAEHESPAAALHAANRALMVQADGAYCTLIYARLERRRDAMECVLASGGHPLPRILRRDGSVERIGMFGWIVGAFAEAQFSDAHARLYAGDTIAFFTDGLTEAATSRAADERVGEDGLDDLLRGCHRGNADETADCLQAAAHHTHDDLTVLVARLAV
jgi:sigma-B regulation protein RsbU (phosphoserine phosphatase)